MQKLYAKNAKNEGGRKEGAWKGRGREERRVGQRKKKEQHLQGELLLEGAGRHPLRSH